MDEKQRNDYLFQETKRVMPTFIDIIVYADECIDTNPPVFKAKLTDTSGRELIQFLTEEQCQQYTKLAAQNKKKLKQQNKKLKDHNFEDDE